MKPSRSPHFHHLCFALLALVLAPHLQGQTLSLTLDDGPKLGVTPLFTPVQRNAAILQHLKQHQAQAMFFVTTGNGSDKPEGLALLRALSEGGQLLANHTMHHPDFNATTTTLADFTADVQGCDQILSTWSGYRRFLRFPYLREGATIEKRDGIRAFLKSKGYRIGYVSIDTSDWLIDEKLQKKLEQNPQADLAPWRTFYLAHLWERVQAYDRLAKGLYSRDVPHTLLLHHNLLNALFLGDAIAMFKQKGCTIVSPDMAYADPAYAVLPQITPLNGSVLESTAQALGIPLQPYFAGFTSERRVGELAGAL